jgi:hypothetical protein
MTERVAEVAEQTIRSSLTLRDRIDRYAAAHGFTRNAAVLSLVADSLREWEIEEGLRHASRERTEKGTEGNAVGKPEIEVVRGGHDSPDRGTREGPPEEG